MCRKIARAAICLDEVARRLNKTRQCAAHGSVVIYDIDKACGFSHDPAVTVARPIAFLWPPKPFEEFVSWQAIVLAAVSIFRW
jgi:hypothetical protein